MRRRATNSTGLSDTGSCFLPWPTSLAFVLGVSVARRRPPSAWITLTHTWTSRMSLTTLCGHCFAISCGAGHSTSWWLDHRHQSSRLLSGTCTTSVGSRSPGARKHGLHPSQVERIRIANLLAERPAEACSTVRSWERGSGSAAAILPAFSVLFDLAPQVELARSGARRTDSRLPSVGADRSALHWRVDLNNGSAVRRSFQRAVSPDPGSHVVSNHYGDTTQVGRVQLQRFAHRQSSSVNTCSHHRQPPGREACF